MREIRLAQEADFLQIQAIYAWYVEHSTATFAYQAPTSVKMCNQWKMYQKRYLYLVCCEDGVLIAYAYAHPFKEKEAYKWNVELTIYVHPQHRHKALGTALMDKLLKILHLQGFYNAYSCITVPNEGSIALHEHFQFQTVARFHKTGYKQGRWLDVVWMERKLIIDESIPLECSTISSCINEINKILHP